MKSPLFILIISAICEALWNMALKKSAGIGDWKINFLGLFFLVIGIITFKKAIGTMPLSIAIIIWSGVSLLLTIILDTILYKTKVDFKTAIFMILSIASIIGLNYFSSKGK